MKISSIIAEYNPFHNGHKYLIEKTKENSDAVICVMSGSFVQRGDAALFDKWVRTKAAILNGADLVLELPVVFAASTAERFAHGAVELISSLGCVDELSFGSESGNIDELLSAGLQLSDESEDMSAEIKKYLAKGYSFPLSRQMAYSGKISENLLNSPNNILAIEYIKAIYKQKSLVKPITSQRVGTGYHDIGSSENYASATALRNMIKNNKTYGKFMPENLEELYKGASLYTIDELNDTIIYLLRTMDAKKIALINDVHEGLENRIKDAAFKYSDISSIVNNVSTKRYTKTKIMRILISILLGIDKKIIHDKISYIRILGFNDTGREIINLIKKKSELPIIIKTADFKGNCEMFKKDILSTDVAALCANSPDKKTGGRDFTTPPVYIASK